MKIVETIDRLSELTLSRSYRRKVDACFLLSSRIAPYYQAYAINSKTGPVSSLLRDHVLFLWSQHCLNSTVSAQDALQFEVHMPEADSSVTNGGLLATYAQNAIVCALHLTWYLVRRDDANVRGCVVNYFDHIDFLAQEKLVSTGGVPQLTDLLVYRSRLFQQETRDFEAAMLQDEGRNIASRPILIANMDRDVSEYL
jgi:hypothetical protein